MMPITKMEVISRMVHPETLRKIQTYTTVPCHTFTFLVHFVSDFPSPT